MYGVLSSFHKSLQLARESNTALPLISLLAYLPVFRIRIQSGQCQENYPFSGIHFKVFSPGWFQFTIIGKSGKNKKVS
jgi:hypothetical protein